MFKREDGPTLFDESEFGGLLRLATLQRIVLTEKLLGGITRRLQRTHLQAPNL